jgi:uncharacterized protein YkwD
MTINKNFSSKMLLSAMLGLSFVGSVSAASFKEEVLAIHNQLRARHYAQPLVWDDQLAAYAENYASKCEFRHSSSPYGENLAAGYPTPAAAIRFWYNEGAHYSYS